MLQMSGFVIGEQPEGRKPLIPYKAEFRIRGEQWWISELAKEIRKLMECKGKILIPKRGFGGYKSGVVYEIETFVLRMPIPVKERRP